MKRSKGRTVGLFVLAAMWLSGSALAASGEEGRPTQGGEAAAVSEGTGGHGSVWESYWRSYVPPPGDERLASVYNSRVERTSLNWGNAPGR